MATGLQPSTDAFTFAIRLVESATANNNAPSGASAGVDVAAVAATIGARPAKASVAVYSTGGSATMTATIRLWGYLAGPAVWLPLGPGADTTKGYLNGGAAIGETGTNEIRHVEELSNAFHFDRLYAEILAIGGTNTAISVDIIAPKAGTP